MATPELPLPVKYFVVIMYKDPIHLERMKAELVRLWGIFDFEGEDHRFDVTDYYEPEMGTPLYRRLVAFEKLYPPTLMVGMKCACNELETQFSINAKRTINLDAGYLDHNKYLLASAKEAGQKVYLDKGIYADLSGRYKAGKYQPFEWSFPDFKDGRYDTELLLVRKLYLLQVRHYRNHNKI